MRVWDFPRLQVAALLILFAVLLLLARPRGAVAWLSLAAAGAAVAWQGTHFAPYTPLVPKQAAGVRDCPPGHSLSLLNVNVLQDNRDFAALLDLVRRMNPDVLLLLETDDGWARAVSPLHAAYPYRSGQPLANGYGMMLFSRMPMSGEIRHRLQPGVPSIEALLRLPSGQDIIVHAVHPEPPMPGRDTGERDAELVMVGSDVRADGRAAVVIGDLNDVGWSDTSRLFRRTSGMLDPRVGRGLYPTYHSDYVFARWPLDHLFVTGHFRLMEIDRLGDIGSDHFPIFYKVCLAEDAGRRLSPESPPPGVRKEAAEEIRQQQSGDPNE